MKWFGLFLIVLSFPASILLLEPNFFGSLTSRRPRSTQIGIDIDNGLTQTSSISDHKAAKSDLVAISVATVKKIEEIDQKIEVAREDLRKNELARQTVIQDFVKIQTQINDIINGQSNL
jgi:hypothetical protein